MRLRYSSRISVLRELLLEHEGERGLLGLARPGALVRQEERPGQLLRQRAGPLHVVGADVGPGRARDAQRVDARVAVEAVVFDRDDGVPKPGRDLRQRHVHPLLVHAEPRAAVGPRERVVSPTPCVCSRRTARACFVNHHTAMPPPTVAVASSAPRSNRRHARPRIVGTCWVRSKCVAFRTVGSGHGVRSRGCQVVQNVTHLDLTPTLTCSHSETAT